MPNLSMGQMGAGLVGPRGLSTYVFGRYAWAYSLAHMLLMGWLVVAEVQCQSAEQT